MRAICEDQEGNLWLGTSGGGLVQLRPQSVHILPAGQGLPNSPPTAIALDASGRLYVGLQRGGLFMGESGRFDRVGGSDGLEVQNFITSVQVARDGTVWAGTLGDGLYGLKDGREVHFTTANGLGDDNVLAVCLDEDGSIWASTSAGTVHRFAGKATTRLDPGRDLPAAPVTAMIASASGGVWLGSQDGQILHEENGTLAGIVGAKALGGFPVLALHEGEQGRLWIGTSGGGLACLTGGVMMSWNTSNGLPNDIVAGVVEDQLKNLWLATGAGIYRVDHGDVHRMFADPGIPFTGKLMSEAKTTPESATVSGGVRAVLSPDGTVWFALPRAC